MIGYPHFSGTSAGAFAGLVLMHIYNHMSKFGGWNGNAFMDLILQKDLEGS